MAINLNQILSELQERIGEFENSLNEYYTFKSDLRHVGDDLNNAADTIIENFRNIQSFVNEYNIFNIFEHYINDVNTNDTNKQEINNALSRFNEISKNVDEIQKDKQLRTLQREISDNVKNIRTNLKMNMSPPEEVENQIQITEQLIENFNNLLNNFCEEYGYDTIEDDTYVDDYNILKQRFQAFKIFNLLKQNKINIEEEINIEEISQILSDLEEKINTLTENAAHFNDILGNMLANIDNIPNLEQCFVQQNVERSILHYFKDIEEIVNSENLAIMQSVAFQNRKYNFISEDDNINYWKNLYDLATKYSNIEIKWKAHKNSIQHIQHIIAAAKEYLPIADRIEELHGNMQGIIDNLNNNSQNMDVTEAEEHLKNLIQLNEMFASSCNLYAELTMDAPGHKSLTGFYLNLHTNFERQIQTIKENIDRAKQGNRQPMQEKLTKYQYQSSQNSSNQSKEGKDKEEERG